MLTKDHIQKALELLGEADRKFDAGRTREGSMLMWEAACAGLSAVADKHGWPKDTRATSRKSSIDWITWMIQETVPAIPSTSPFSA